MKGCVTTLTCVMALMPFFLTSCGSGNGSVAENKSTRGYNPGVGPFDSNGNYVERWADDKSKGRWWRKSTSKPSAVAKTKTPKVTPPVIASNITPRPPVIPAPSIQPRPRPPVSGTTIPSPRPKPPVVSRPKPKPKPKPVVKTKPKTKAPITHTVVKGDTLYGLSRKYGISVTAIQRANGLKNTNLSLGKKLLIPRY